LSVICRVRLGRVNKDGIGRDETIQNGKVIDTGPDIQIRKFRIDSHGIGV